MLRRAMIVTAAILASANGAAAGQCSEAVAALERSVAALQAQPNTGATAASPAGSTGRQSAVEHSTRIAQQAKELDRQGKEAECMQMLKEAKGWPPQSE
jgi:autotransporter adhesin